MSPFQAELLRHYEATWGKASAQATWLAGPADELDGMCVVVFPPRAERHVWTYATCGMSDGLDSAARIELHLLSPVESLVHVETLTAIAHYHRTGATLGLGHTVNFGRPWLPESTCSYGLISLPYLDGPAIEQFTSSGAGDVQCYWLIPITEAERTYKSINGLEALEQRFEAVQFGYADPKRASVV